MKESKNTTDSTSVAIPKVENLGYDEFVQDYLNTNRPVVISDALKQWPATSKWSPEFFRNQYGSREIQIDDERLCMEDFIELVLDSSKGKVAPYFRNVLLSEQFPDLLPDLLPVPPYILPNWFRGPFYPSAGREAELYIGGAGGGFPFLHYDSNSTHAFLGQVYGKKEAVLFSPDQSEFLYPRSEQRRRHHSWITDVENQDQEDYPLFRNAIAHRGLLKSGDLLYIPSRWWHTARMLSPSITVSYNVGNQSNWDWVRDEICYKAASKSSLLVFPLFTYMTLLGLGHRLWDEASGGAVKK